MKINEKNKKNLKRIILILVSLFGALVIIYASLIFVLSLLNSQDTPDIIDTLHEVNYSIDIFDDCLYLAKNRDVYYLEYGTGEALSQDNIDDLTGSALLFYRYFDSIINGDYINLSSFYTDEYKIDYPLPDKFTMQKLYDIQVDLFERRRDDRTDGIVIETFIVSYKIMENNGSFRSDLPSDTLIPLAYELINKNGSIKINAIKGIKTVFD